jgi:pimeloyl-ACP methyl ester carboxylesterase
MRTSHRRLRARLEEVAGPRLRKDAAPQVIVSVGVAALLGIGALWLARGPLLAWIALNVPRLTGTSIDQKIAFAETSDGVRIAYATSGSGPPLVFVLGWGTHLTEGMGSPLYDQSGFLSWHSREHRVVRYDGRGFGLSDRDVTDFSLDARLRDLETVVDALGLPRFDLYAFSAGGPTGVAYAARHTERVSRLVLAATYAGIQTDPERQRMLADLVGFAEPPGNADGRASFAEFLAPEANDVQRRVLMHFLGVAADGPQILGFFRDTGAIDTSEEAGRIDVPTLVAASDSDSAIPLAHSRRLASLIPTARFEIIDGASHIGASGQDPRVMRLISDFLAAPVPPTTSR